MKTNWTRLEDGTWGVRIENAPWPQGTGVGMPVRVTAQDGRYKDVVLGKHVRGYRVRGGRFVDLYEVAA